MHSRVQKESHQQNLESLGRAKSRRQLANLLVELTTGGRLLRGFFAVREGRLRQEYRAVRNVAATALHRPRAQRRATGDASHGGRSSGACSFTA